MSRSTRQRSPQTKPGRGTLCWPTILSFGAVAQQIGQDRVQVIGIMKPGMDPHSYEPTPNDVIWFKKADLVLYNGLHLEGRLLASFAPPCAVILRTVKTPKRKSRTAPAGNPLRDLLARPLP